MSSPDKNLWAKKTTTIYLSPDRRGRLADYASCTDQQMSPAETIYALIDTASVRDSEEFVSLSDVKAELNTLRNHMDEQKKIIRECTLALHAVFQSLEAMRDLVQETVSPRIP